jgi:hypothetical protein
MSDRAKRANPAKQGAETGMHPAVIEIVLGAVLWFVLVTWMSFARGGGIDFDLVIATLFFAFFFGLFLVVASFTAKDPRWRLPDTSFREFLRSQVGTATGKMRGRDALIEIAIVPVSLALAATAIGIVWIALH